MGVTLSPFEAIPPTLSHQGRGNFAIGLVLGTLAAEMLDPRNRY